LRTSHQRLTLCVGHGFSISHDDRITTAAAKAVVHTFHSAASYAESAMAVRWCLA
jgi:hypothetical protein